MAGFAGKSLLAQSTLVMMLANIVVTSGFPSMTCELLAEAGLAEGMRVATCNSSLAGNAGGADGKAVLIFDNLISFPFDILLEVRN